MNLDQMLAALKEFKPTAMGLGLETRIDGSKSEIIILVLKRSVIQPDTKDTVFPPYIEKQAIEWENRIFENNDIGLVHSHGDCKPSHIEDLGDRYFCVNCSQFVLKETNL